MESIILLARKIKGKKPIEVIKMYMEDPLPHVTITKDIEDAHIFYDEKESKEIAYLTDMKVEKVKGVIT